jgi:tetratricopeptide (TPR) repeat protein
MQITGTKYSGKRIETQSSGAYSTLRFAMEMNRRNDGAEMEAGLRGSTNFNDRSDYSVALAYLGRNKEAIELLQELEKEQPGQYFIAANLGTVYELSGNNEEGLRWINEGIRRNSDSHDGTEWLHAKILEAKIAREKDPDYFKKHSVLDLQPDKIGSEIIIDGRRFSPQEVAKAIESQLEERMQFVKPPDPAVASLLFDYASIEAATEILESAERILQLAVEYGYPPERVQPLLKLYDRKIALGKATHIATFVLAWLGVSCLLFGLLYFLYKRGIFVISSRDLKRQK